VEDRGNLDVGHASEEPHLDDARLLRHLQEWVLIEAGEAARSAMPAIRAAIATRTRWVPVDSLAKR